MSHAASSDASAATLSTPSHSLATVSTIITAPCGRGLWGGGGGMCVHMDTIIMVQAT